VLDEIKKFYEKTKIVKFNDDEGIAPITFVHVFHKHYPRLPSIKLPQVDVDGEFEGLLKSRKSVREFSEEPISLTDLAKILHSSRIVDPNRDPERRTYPSAGARFPVEIYLTSFNVNGLEKGAYHYDITQMKLEQLWKKDLGMYKEEIVSPYLRNPAAALILTSVVPRSEVKYGYKAYPYSLIEVGHIAQNILLSCCKYNVGACPVGGFVNNRVTEILDLTQDELPLYVIGLGRNINH